MYKFTVDKAEKIDMQRVVNDHTKANDATLVVSENGNKYLFLSNKFLANFYYKDGVEVCEQCLSDGWGYGNYGIEQAGNGFVLDPCYGNVLLLKGARWAPLEDVAFMKKELEIARSFVRKIVVKVHDI